MQNAEKATFFWTEYIKKDLPPPPQSISDCQVLFQHASLGKSIEASPEILDLIRKLKTLESQTQLKEGQIEGIKQELMMKMEDAEAVTHLGKPIVTWKAPKPSSRIDTKRLSLDHPELIKAYQSPVMNSRRFVVKDWPEALLALERWKESSLTEGDTQ